MGGGKQDQIFLIKSLGGFQGITHRFKAWRVAFTLAHEDLREETWSEVGLAEAMHPIPCKAWQQLPWVLQTPPDFTG